MSELSVRAPRFGVVLAVAISLAALVASTGGVAGAKSQDVKDETRLLTVATGSVEVVADGEQIPVPMQNQAFTQKAGSAIMFITTVSSDIPGFEGRDCGAYVAWNRLGDTLFLPDTSIVNLGIWGKRQTFFLPSASTDAHYPTMEVGASSSSECPYGEGGSFPTFTVDVQVQVWAIR
jgi:hypothetical protein